MKKYFYPAFLCLALIIGCSSENGRPLRPGAGGNAKAADFAIQGVSGNIVRLGYYSGSVVLLEFWSVYCGSCLYVQPLLNKLQTDYSGKGFSVLGINTGDLEEEVARYAKEYRVSYPLGIDKDSNVVWNYKVRGTPYLLLIDRKGVIRKSWLGYSSEMDSDITASVKSLLSEPS